MNKKNLLPLLLSLFLCFYIDASDNSFALESKYTVDTTWPSGYQATVNLTNPSDTGTFNWSAIFILPPGQAITDFWNGVYTADGQVITVKNPSWIGGEKISALSSTTFGMIVSKTNNDDPSLENLQAIANSDDSVNDWIIPPVNSVEPDHIPLNDAAVSIKTTQETHVTQLPCISHRTSKKGGDISCEIDLEYARDYSQVEKARQVRDEDCMTDLSGFSRVSEKCGLDPTPSGNIEHAAWYIDWTSWDYPAPEALNTVHIFVGNMHLDKNGRPVIDGFGNFTDQKMKTFVHECHERGIAVKISIGGGGGSYDHCWSILTTSNVAAFAQALVDFCTLYGLDGVDFDIEEFHSKEDRPSQQMLSGRLIKEFKTLAPHLSTSLCSNAGFGPYFPWSGVVQNIFEGSSTIDTENGIKTIAIDRLYIMSYYDPIENEKKWLLGWYDWVKTNYHFQPYQLSVGIDDTDAHAYDIRDMAVFAAQNGFSTGYWEFDPAREANSNASMHAILNAYQENIPQ